MTVAAVMPTYNQAEFIRQAIDSVVGQVDDLVIVNDGSTDKTAEILRRLPPSPSKLLTVIPLEENGGTARAINEGIHWLRTVETDQLQYDWFTWVSSDNAHSPDWMETLLAAADADTGVVWSGFDYVSAKKSCYHRAKPYDPGRLIGKEACYFGPSFIIRADVWQTHRGKISHDYDNWLRVEEACWEKGLKIVPVDRALCMYRAHSKRVTITRRHEYDAKHWQKIGRERRQNLGIAV